MTTTHQPCFFQGEALSRLTGDPRSTKQIADTLSISYSAAHGRLSGMLKWGWVERHTDKNGGVTWSMTSEGWEAWERF